MLDKDQAIDYYSKAIQSDANYEMAYNNRGTVYFESEEYDKALKDFKKAIEINSDYAMALCNRAAIYHLQEHYTGALADLEQAVATAQQCYSFTQ